MFRLQPSHVVHSCSLAVCAAGSLAFLDWLLNPDPSLFGGGALGPTTAMAFVLAGLALLCVRDKAGGSRSAALVPTLGGAVALFAGVRMTAWACDLAPLLPLAAPASSASAVISAGLLLVGVALVTFDRQILPGIWCAECLAVATAALAIVPLVAYGYSGMPAMSLTAAAMLLALAVGIGFARPRRGMMGVIFSDAMGGMLARRMLPAAILVPCVLGLLRVLGQHWELYGTEMGAALLVASIITIFCGATLAVASLLNRLDQDRESANESLRQRNDEIYDLYSRAPCGYHSLDADGLYQAINDTELDWLGRERDEVVGKAAFADFLTTETRSTFIGNFEKFKQQGSITGLELSLLRGNGDELPVILNATAVYDAAGDYLTSRSTLFDATELKRAEQISRRLHAQLEQRVKERTAELARSNAELMQKNQENAMFVYGVSHDLRSPLVNLEGFSSELSMVCDELRDLVATGNLSDELQNRSLTLIDEDMRQSIRFIQTAVKRLSNIIDALLRLSRAGRVEYQWQPVNLQDTVSRIVEAMSGSIDERSAMVRIRDLPPVYGDPTAVEQVFANLIGNAVNYLSPDRPGEIEIGSLDAESGTATSGDEADSPRLQTFYVKDNGLGIPKAYQAKVFQALKRLHPEAAKGEGIGLALVRRIVERHGGKIWFRSIEDSGTEFYFTLPLYEKENRGNPTPSFPVTLLMGGNAESHAMSPVVS